VEGYDGRKDVEAAAAHRWAMQALSLWQGEGVGEGQIRGADV